MNSPGAAPTDPRDPPPADAGPPADGESARLSDPRAADRRALLIEDDPTFARVLAEVVRAQGFVPVVAARGDVGQAMARQLAPRVIVLDVRLPGIDGWTLLDRLKHEPATRHVPVCVVTGDDRRARALGLGAFAFLRKPCSRDDLLDALAAADALAGRYARRVLLVAGDPGARADTIALFADPRFELTAVDSAAGAVGALEAARYDAVAVVPPLGDAAPDALLRAIARTPAGGGLPVLVCLPQDAPRADVAALAAAAPEARVRVARTPDQLLEQAVGALHLREADLDEDSRDALDRARRTDGALAGRRVLVVDDDPRNIFALGSLLEMEGMAYIAARSGPEALAVLTRGEPVDVVLMDIMMPGMDGYEATRAIRAMPAVRDLPVIALTAKAMKGDRDRCLDAGATDYLAKPVDSEQLLSTLRVNLTELA